MSQSRRDKMGEDERYDAVRGNSADDSQALDYYNDDTPKRVVGRLFGNAFSGKAEGPEETDDDEDLVRGFERAKPKPKHEPDHTPKTGRAATGAKREAPHKGYEEPVNHKAYTSPKRSNAYNPGDDGEEDDADYGFSLYRRKSRQEQNWDSYMDAEEPVETRAPRGASGAHMTDGDAVKRVTPKYNQAKNKDVYKPPSTAHSKKVFFEEDDDDDYDDESPLPVKTIALSVMILLSVVLLAVMAFQLNAANQKLKEATANQEQAAELEQKNSEIKMQNDTLQARVADLEAKLAMYTQGGNPATPEGEEGGAGEGITTPTSPIPAPGNNQNTTATATGGKQYTIETGDTLSSISKKMYGTTTRANDIQAANNITDPTKLKLGQVLQIPPK